MPPAAGLTPVVCLEGPSAVGKTALAAALEREAGAFVVPELLPAADAPQIPESASWLVERHAEQWRRVRALAARAAHAGRPVALDGDPFKGLWYNWVFADDGWPGADMVVPLYRAHVVRGTLAFPDLYVLLGATEAQLRARRAADLPTRRRRHFETHLRVVGPQRRYFAALQAADPRRVLPLLDTSDRDATVAAVLAALASVAPPAPDAAESVRLLDHMAAWVASHAPDDQGGDA